ncbi:MAG TPA: nucleoside-diphosphate kinase [Candidatus Norongarragalinales archaeon]|nr:nucleoside-diphosphate kinase [Candidatus Norongarragalinales archaeon]
MERTLILLKPDCLQRGLVGEVAGRFEKKGLKIVGMKMLRLQDAILDEHYSHLLGKPFFNGIKAFMKATPVIAMVLEGLECVEVVRTMCGPTNARKAAAGTIRGDYGMSVQSNIVHASDSIEAAEREIKRFFIKTELFEYAKSEEGLVYSVDEKKG